MKVRYKRRKSYWALIKQSKDVEITSKLATAGYFEVIDVHMLKWFAPNEILNMVATAHLSSTKSSRQIE